MNVHQAESEILAYFNKWKGFSIDLIKNHLDLLN